MEKEIPFYSQRLHVKPGLTGFAQVRDLLLERFNLQAGRLVARGGGGLLLSGRVGG